MGTWIRDCNRISNRIGAVAAGMLLAGTLGLAGITAQPPCAWAADGSETRTVVDMADNEVEVPAEIDNLFNGYPVNCGVMSMLGGSDTMQYYLPRLMSDNWGWLRELDPTIEGKPTIGEDAVASAEEVLSIDPDVVVISNNDTAATYEEAGITIFKVNASTTEEFLEAVIRTGELLGEEQAEKAQQFVDYYQANIDLVAERVAGIPEDERPTVYYVGGTTAYDTRVAGNGIEFVTNAGGRFALSQDDMGGAVTMGEVTAEQLLAADPDIIIVGTNNRAKGYESLMSDEALSGLSAIKNGQVYTTPQGTLPWDTYGPEQAMAVLWMGKVLYPDLFEDIDLVQEMKDFYRTFYGYELTDEYAQLMLDGVMGPEQAAEKDAAA